MCGILAPDLDGVDILAPLGRLGRIMLPRERGCIMSWNVL